MTENTNPITAADETGVVYRENGEDPVYVLVQVKRDNSSEEFVDVDIATAGLDREQTIAVLEGVLETLRTEKTPVLPDIDSDLLPL
jgi:hypothetical protein